jgi:ubiquinone/menaquinone biosynthesis C-methylase UbiE
MTTTPTTTPTPDLAAIKTRQQATWASGDYSAIAALIVPVAERLADATDLRAGTRVLDIATGSGNAAIAAARIGCDVTGVDYVPGLLERGRERAAAERLAITFRDGDAEDLPFPDASFDAVLQVFGAMFAPDHQRTAAELVRVCRPGARIGLASWTSEGFLGDMFRTIGAHVPPPAGLASPMRWGDEAYLESIFGDTVEWLGHTRRVFTFRFTSAEAFVSTFGTWYGPTLKAFEGLDDRPRLQLADDLAALARRHNRLDEEGAIAIPGEYLESVGLRR